MQIKVSSRSDHADSTSGYLAHWCSDQLIEAALHLQIYLIAHYCCTTVILENAQRHHTAHTVPRATLITKQIRQHVRSAREATMQGRAMID